MQTVVVDEARRELDQDPIGQFGKLLLDEPVVAFGTVLLGGVLGGFAGATSALPRHLARGWGDWVGILVVGLCNPVVVLGWLPFAVLVQRQTGQWSAVVLGQASVALAYLMLVTPVAPRRVAPGWSRWVGGSPLTEALSWRLALLSRPALLGRLIEPLAYAVLAWAFCWMIGADQPTQITAAAATGVGFLALADHNSLGRRGPGGWLELVYSPSRLVIGPSILPVAGTLAAAAITGLLVEQWRGAGWWAASVVLLCGGWAGLVAQLTSVLLPYRTARRHPVIRSAAPAAQSLVTQLIAVLVTAAPLLATVTMIKSSPLTGALLTAVGVGAHLVGTRLAGALLGRRLHQIYGYLTRG